MNDQQIPSGTSSRGFLRSAVDVIAKAVTCMIAAPIGYLVASFAGFPLLYTENMALIGSAWAITAWCLVVCSATFASWYVNRYRRLGFPF